MKAEIISVGTELLLGHTVNTDATHVARELSALGLDLLQVHTVGDNPQRLEKALREALERAEVVITTGGLGPTEDDLTKETVALVAKAPLEEHADSMARLASILARGPCRPIRPSRPCCRVGLWLFPILWVQLRAAPRQWGMGTGCSCCRGRLRNFCPCCTKVPCPLCRV